MKKYTFLENISEKLRKPLSQKDVKGILVLNEIKQWCDKIGLDIVFSNHETGDFYDFEENYINISRRKGPMRQACILLHEIGHYKVFSSGLHDSRYKRGYGAPAHIDSFRKRLVILEEEFEAWHKGEELAHEILIWENVESDFIQLKNDSMTQYVEWVTSKKKVRESV
jgi:hypothetical protein